jgi:hypothetical protein
VLRNPRYAGSFIERPGERLWLLQFRNLCPNLFGFVVHHLRQSFASFSITQRAARQRPKRPAVVAGNE